MTLHDVAKRLANDDPPAWLIQALEEFADLIRQPRNDPEIDTIERNLFRYAEYIQRWLPLYARLEDYEFEGPWNCIDDLSSNLEEFRQFLAKEITHSTSGDPRRKLCAAVCAEGYRFLHDGHLEPHSLNIRQACEDLWLACGNPTTLGLIATQRPRWQEKPDSPALVHGSTHFVPRSKRPNASGPNQKSSAIDAS